MKIIDLLNRIAKGEEVPQKFMVDGDILYIGEDKFIEHANGERIEWFIYPSWLNEEVEILEEKKKIPEKINIKFWSDEEYTPEQRINVCMTYIDEIIDYLDYLKSKGDE